MPACKHCGEGAEHGSDACYGCRNRHHDAGVLLIRAQGAIQQARDLLEAEEADIAGIEAGDALARVQIDLNTTRKGVDQ